MGKIPLWKDKLHIWVSGIAMHRLMFFIIPGFKSSHPAELSLKLEMTLTTSSSVTDIKQKHSYDVCWTKSRGSLCDFGIAPDRLEPPLTKKLVQFVWFLSLSLIIVPLLSNTRAVFDICVYLWSLSVFTTTSLNLTFFQVAYPGNIFVLLYVSNALTCYDTFCNCAIADQG